jgi:hypothetical protein
MMKTKNCISNTAKCCCGSAYNTPNPIKLTGSVNKIAHVTHPPYKKLSGYIDSRESVANPT